MGIIRSSFLIDEKGNVLRAWYKVKPEDTVPNAREVLRSNLPPRGVDPSHCSTKWLPTDLPLE